MRMLFAVVAVAVLIMCALAMIVPVEAPGGASVLLEVEDFTVHAEPPRWADVDLRAAETFPKDEGNLAAADLVNDSVSYRHALDIYPEVAVRLLTFRGACPCGNHSTCDPRELGRRAAGVRAGA